MPAIVHNTHARTPRTVPSLIASEGEHNSDEEDDNGEDDNGFDGEDFDIDEETEVGVDNDIEREVNYDVEKVNDHDIISRPISFALEKDAYLSKKRGLKETGSYASLINTLVFGGAMIDSKAVADPNDIEEMEDLVLEQIKAQDLNQLPRSTQDTTAKKKWTIDVPYGTSKVEQTVSCLIHLQLLQKSRPDNPSQERPFYFKKGLIGAAVKEYARRLVGGVLRGTRVIYDENGNFVQMREDMKNEPWINTEHLAWKSKKLVGNGGSEVLSPSTSHSSTALVFAAELLTCSNVTHSSRHSGAKEAVRLNYPEEEISAGGRWSHDSGKMQQHYLAKRPIMFARYIAGFSDRPFHLKRNKVASSLGLQRLVFDFIEKSFGEKNSEENRIWRMECDEEMKEVIFNISTPMGSNKKFVLKTLLRLRRGLLQDSAEYLYRYKPEQSPLLQVHDLFTHPLFEEFKVQVHKALDRPVKQIPNNLSPNLISALDAWCRETHAGLAESNRKMEDLDEWMVSFEKLFRMLFSHTSWANNMMCDIKADTASMMGTQPSPPPPLPMTFMHTADFTPGGQSPVFPQGFQIPVMSSSHHPLAFRPNHHQYSQQAISTRSRPLRPILAPQPPLRRPPSLSPIPTFPVLGRRRGGRDIGAGTREAPEARVLSQSASGQSDGPLTGGSAPVPVPASLDMAKQWFVPASRPRSTRALYDEYMLILDLSATNDKSDLVAKTLKQTSDRKAIYDRITHLRKANITKGLSEEDALGAACTEVDNKVPGLTGARAGDPYNKNQAVVYCRNERIQPDMDKGKVIKNCGRTKTNDDYGSTSKGKGKKRKRKSKGKKRKSKGKEKSKGKKKSNDESNDETRDDEE
ncbi:hypothetical protein EC957_009308 [Mortierella hygrophila]|uniref:Uncharacterized protein n=1 Tax=Mortierella hygrophila TaxID=979708 RepID=A0A9P6FAI8_9FUNG|nr:hypothetical protein EC957_009308 [Mortierella hygrophila]